MAGHRKSICYDLTLTRCVLDCTWAQAISGDDLGLGIGLSYVSHLSDHAVSLQLVFVCFVLSAVGSFPTFAGDPGLVVVIDQNPEPAQFTLPALSPYKFDYDPARISLWDTPTKDNLVPPDTEFTAPNIAGDFDLDVDVDLNDFQFLQICFTGDGIVDLLDYEAFETYLGGPAVPVSGGCGGLDLDDDQDVDLMDFALFQTVFGDTLEPPPVSLMVFAEGLAPSTILGDAMITLLDDPDGDEVFTVEATQPVTVVSIDISPSSGPPGTALTVTMQPAIAPLAFDSVTTADWEGVYQPPVSPPTDPFQVTYDASQFRESSPSEAVLIIGDGTVTNAPDYENLEGPGTTPGTFTFHLPGLTLQRSFTFAPESDAAVWEQVDYPDGPGGMAMPVLDGEPNELPVMLLSGTPDPLNPSEDLLLHASGFHIAAVVRIDENPETTADAPATLHVDLISYNAAEVEIDRVENVQLDRVAGDDGDADRIVYHNDLEVPIVLVDVDLDEGSYPNVVSLEVVDGGAAVIVPSLD